VSKAPISFEKDVTLRGLASIGSIGLVLIAIGFLIAGYAASAPIIKAKSAVRLLTDDSKFTEYTSLTLVIIGSIMTSFSFRSIARESGWHVIGDGMNVWALYMIFAIIFYTIGMGFKDIGSFTGMVSKSLIFYSLVDATIALILVFLAGQRIYNPLFAIGRLRGGRYVASIARYGLILGAILLPVGFGGYIIFITLLIVAFYLVTKASRLPVKVTPSPPRG
jgi:hypothetical protein